ncbi:SAM-dependent methyltransferase [Nonomuraea sp. NPDC049141]|uniref:SAM-dependent methyltransferase n=1 Tax=Nonomuraea sp. NPDC049141 TaxID=3155500 RepID=UPI0033C96394
MATEGDSPVTSLAGVSTARMYDAAQGGKQNFAADRAALRAARRISADAGTALVAHHQHVGRVVRHLAEAGAEQYVLVGTGLPGQGHAHEVIHEIYPMARVVYAECDPYMLAYAEAIIGRGTDRVRIVGCDLSRPAGLLDDPVVRTFVDWERPVVVGVLSTHEIPGGDTAQLARLRAAMVPGSHLWLTVISLDGYDDAVRRAVAASHRELGLVMHLRTREQALALFDGLDLLDPGLVWVPQWRPDGTEVEIAPARTGWLGGVARIR